MAQSNINKSSHFEEVGLQKDEVIQKSKDSWIAALISFASKDVRKKRFSSRFTLHSSPRPAFTLAEVLITLGVIGVVAAMTIPTLMKVISDVQYKSAYKKAYSTLYQAILAANTGDGLTNVLSWTDHITNFKVIMSYLKTSKTCYSGTDLFKCWNADGEYWNSTAYKVGRGPQTGDVSAIDVSGISWSTETENNFAGRILVDTNGLKAPNQYGKDRFMFLLLNENKITNNSGGVPYIVTTEADNSTYACTYNKCATENNYYAKSWLYN